MYNIHPLFVHFPIALLFIYSGLRLVPMSRLFPLVAWRQIERALLIFGVLGAFVALATGETAEHLVRPERALIEAHSFFATMTTWLYGALVVGEILAITTPLLKKNLSGVQQKAGWWRLTTGLESILTNRVFSATVALVALITLALTGLLGGVMVYGVSADPLAPFVLKLLGIPLAQ